MGNSPRFLLVARTASAEGAASFPATRVRGQSYYRGDFQGCVVSSNAIQLARCAGYRVIATASPRNFGYVRSLGAAAAVDYHSRTAADKIVDALGDSPLAGTLAIGSGSVPAALSITARAHGRRRIAAAQPQLITRLQTAFRPHRGIHVSGIWGGTLKDNEVGPGIYADFLPAALASGIYRAAPEAVVAGEGLEQIPAAIDQLRQGVSAKKLVVRV